LPCPNFLPIDHFYQFHTFHTFNIISSSLYSKPFPELTPSSFMGLLTLEGTFSIHNVIKSWMDIVETFHGSA
jgi:hypothetical protein